MKTTLGFAGGFVCVLASLASAQPKQQPPGQAKKETAPAVDNAALAEKLVGKTGNIKEGEIVEIVGGPGDLALLEELAVAVRKRGAFPLIVYSSETLAKKLVAEVPDKYDAQVNAAELALTKVINARIVIPPVRDPSIMAALPPARRAAMGKAGTPIEDLNLKRSVRLVELGNGFAPSPSRAKMLGLTDAELAKIFWDGVNADYSAVETSAKSLKALLAKGGELEVTHANGTKLKMKIKGRKVLVSDGVISDEDKKAGGANVNAWLPAGEVYLTPVPGSVEGKIVDDRFLFEGNEVLGLTLEVKAGKITNITAKSGWDVVKPHYDAAGPGKAEVSMIDFGINPAIKTTAKLENYVSAGTVTIGTGGNTWAGGTNKEPFGLQLFLPGTTVTLDGKPIIENGALK